MRRLFLVLALIGWAGLAAAQAPRPPADGTVECRFEGWSNDLDEKGQPVRAAPDAGAIVVGRLPPPVGIGLDEVSVTVTVTGYRDGWFRIAEAGYSDEVQGVRVPRNRVVKATGWVPAAGVKALIAAKELKQAPGAGIRDGRGALGVPQRERRPARRLRPGRDRGEAADRLPRLLGRGPDRARDRVGREGLRAPARGVPVGAPRWISRRAGTRRGSSRQRGSARRRGSTGTAVAPGHRLARLDRAHLPGEMGGECRRARIGRRPSR